MRIKIAAISISVKFAAGPAYAINAERFGYFRSHSGLNGALAQPIIELANRNARIGITTMPHGSRLICGIGFSVTCPPRSAVSSPPSFATSACEASWHVVENKNATYQINPITKVSELISGIPSLQITIKPSKVRDTRNGLQEPAHSASGPV